MTRAATPLAGAATGQFDVRALVGSFEPALTAQIRTTLAEVEAELRRRISDTPDPWLNEAAGHLIRAGGKRLRPLLVTLAAHTGRPDQRKVVCAAVAAELVHVATLYHDDVMDSATIRHGVPSANSLWGNRLAVLIGNHLLGIAASTGLEISTDFVRRQGLTLTRLVRGQATEGASPRRGESPAEQYLRVASDKSAALFAFAAWAGAVCGETGERTAAGLAGFGEALGVAFQISDDLLDIVADTADFGKTRGIDLQQGVRTLPILRALAAGDSHADRLAEILSAGAVSDPGLRQEALRLLRSSPALEQTYDDLRRHAAEAERSLADVPDGPARDALLSVCNFVVRRTY
ncbi:polyprenyl synthetase family protein [Actinoplanes sp. LDG1-06]|uniref:Polyprenyl synthetase family protein n=1 Tax=Paractinoplanes ovalisporus TaxID=2810368 RepID=A0ABS2AWP2_9ACTN|nr:polyprenyl synthetase family protein [Actinoplanes ovalisporus]MBM2623646.1 polyprenyl synthetase family protein [Actinoplanes ovalisporus]